MSEIPVSVASAKSPEYISSTEHQSLVVYKRDRKEYVFDCVLIQSKYIQYLFFPGRSFVCSKFPLL